MAKGDFAKKAVTNQILATFKDSFVYNDGKEIRIPIIEDGERIEVKVVLTRAAKNVGGNAESETPTVSAPEAPSNISQPTEEEKKTVSSLLNSISSQF